MARTLVHHFVLSTDGAGAAVSSKGAGINGRVIGVQVNFAAGAGAGVVPSLECVSRGVTKVIWTGPAGATDIPMREIIEQSRGANDAVVAAEYRNPLFFGSLVAKLTSGANNIADAAVISVMMESA